MGLLSMLEMRAQNLENPNTTLAAPAAWFVEALGASPSLTGVPVSPKTALSYAPAAACIRVLGETLGTVPAGVNRRTGERTVERAHNHPVHRLLHEAFIPPDEYGNDLTPFNGKVVGQGHLGGWGNAFYEIEFDNSGYPRALLPLLPDRTFAERRDGQKIIRTSINNKPVGLPASRVLHIHGWGYDGLNGYSPIKLAMQGIGLGMALERNQATFFGNSSRPAGVLQTAKVISPERAKLLKEQFEMMHQGLSQAHRVAVLEDGLSFNPMMVNPEDAQLIESRKFQVEEQCRWYRMPPHMIQHLERSTNNNIEHQSLEFVKFTMLPWFTCWEQALNLALLSAKERAQGFFIRFTVQALLRGDMKARFDSYTQGRQWGWLSANDCRELEDMNPLPGTQGDIYLVPMNMIPADQAAALGAESSERAPAASRAPAAAELRQARSAAERNRYRLCILPVFRHGAESIVSLEANHLRRWTKKLAAGEVGAAEFEAEMERFWAGLREKICRAFRPPAEALADLLQPALENEVGAALTELPMRRADLVGYSQDLGNRYISASRDAVRQALGDGSLETLASEWEDGKASGMAEGESVLLAARLALDYYRAAGVPAARWHALPGGSPACADLHGRRVEAGAPFALAGETLGNGQELHVVTEPVLHPPLIPGRCDCLVVAAP